MSHGILEGGHCKGIFLAFIAGREAMEKHVDSHLIQYRKNLAKWQKDPTAKVMTWKRMLEVVGDTQDGRLIMFMNMVFGLQPLVYSCGKKVDNIPLTAAFCTRIGAASFFQTMHHVFLTPTRWILTA
jgi:hypothetical protein